MQKYWIKCFVSVLIGMMCLVFFNLPVHAHEHYDVYHYDKWEEAVPSQAGYIAERAVSGRNLKTKDFSEPSDMIIDTQERIFIADTGNNRIVIADVNLTEMTRILKEFTYPDGKKTTLNHPKGIYIAPETGFLYIADTDNARVLICDENGSIQKEITKPDSVLFSQELTFFPEKVIADKAGNVYIVLGNITSGTVMFNAEGEFLGYYGANTVEATSAVITEYFWKKISTEEMRSRTVRTVPTAITNFDLDADGFLYTCSQSVTQKKDAVKKLNSAGTNLFSRLKTIWGDYESIYDTNTNTNYQSMLCDIEISEDGSINCLDMTAGRIFQYDKEGNLLFIFGSSSEQLGGFIQPSAVESFDNRILVLDSKKNSITIFKETDFGAVVHEAENLYNSGYYEESLAPWYKVLQYDGNYRRAFLGISSALLVKGEYEDSMQYAKLADSSYRYNKAFECFRSEWMTQHIYSFLIGIAVICFLIKKNYKKITFPENFSDFNEKQWLFYTINHPIKGFREMRWKKTGSLKYTLLILSFWFIGTIFYYRDYGFQFRSEPDKIFNMIPYFMQTILLFLAWTIGNWAVCTLLDGEGKLKNIFLYSGYALLPYVVSLYLEVIFSHILIQDEQVFLELIHLAGLVWSGILIISAVKTVHQYSFRKTLGAILLTIISMLIMLFLLILILSLFQQIYIFIYSIYTEIAYRLKV